jgi:hypothetical protein
VIAFVTRSHRLDECEDSVHEHVGAEEQHQYEQRDARPNKGADPEEDGKPLLATPFLLKGRMHFRLERPGAPSPPAQSTAAKYA